jgi:hypothetical protein
MGPTPTLQCCECSTDAAQRVSMRPSQFSPFAWRGPQRRQAEHAEQQPWPAWEVEVALPIRLPPSYQKRAPSASASALALGSATPSMH